MKKTTIFSIFANLLALSIIMASCGKEIEAPSPKNNNQTSVRNNKSIGTTYAEKVTYSNEHLTILGKAALLLAQDEPFRTVLYNEVEKQFDGDFNIPFETLASLAGNDGLSIGEKLNAKVQMVDNRTSLTTELEAFQNVEGDLTVYPQIYIHNFEDHKINGMFDAPYTEKTPVVVINVGDIEDNFVGFTLDASNQIVTVAEPIDEKYALTHEVWVISLNDQIRPITTVSGDSHNDKTIHRNINPKIEKMRVKAHFESWASGKSDVRIRRFSTFINGIDYGRCSPNGPSLSVRNNYFAELEDNAGDNGKGTPIRKFDRKEVKNQNEITINWVYYNNWDYLRCLNGSPEFPNRGDHFYYAVFEHDPWPTATKYFPVTSNANYTLEIPCRTTEGSAFATGIIASDDARYNAVNLPFFGITVNVSYFAGAYSVNNGNIQFNSKL
jgi:hypothetical protein